MDLFDPVEEVLATSFVHEGVEVSDVLDSRVELRAGGPDHLEAEDFVWPKPVGVRHHPTQCPPRFG
ncbi:hypothetical protein ACU4GG_08670 [Streptomyces nojiriensis]